MVLRVHGMDEAGVRFPVGPLCCFYGHVAELVYAYASGAYVARLEGSNPSMPTVLFRAVVYRSYASFGRM